MTNMSISGSQSPFSMTYGLVSKEVVALAQHQLEILECRFPNYHYILYEWPFYWSRIEIFGGNRPSVASMVLVVSFTPRSIKIAAPPFKVLTLIHDPRRRYHNLAEEINYADPRFTENTLSDILERLAR